AATLQDWAAPAIQYCRALEFECKRRLYTPCPNKYLLNRAGFTLGTITTAYLKRSFDGEAKNNWETLLWCVEQSGSDPQEFEQIVQRMVDEAIIIKRNLLAHGGAVTGEIAASLRRSIIGDRIKPGVLCWLAEYVYPVQEDG